MRRTTSHKLSFLMYNQRANSPMEAQVWNKIAKWVFNLKIKMTKRILTVRLLQKLKDRKTGTNEDNSISGLLPESFRGKMQKLPTHTQ